MIEFALITIGFLAIVLSAMAIYQLFKIGDDINKFIDKL